MSETVGPEDLRSTPLRADLEPAAPPARLGPLLEHPAHARWTGRAEGLLCLGLMGFGLLLRLSFLSRGDLILWESFHFFLLDGAPSILDVPPRVMHGTMMGPLYHVLQYCLGLRGPSAFELRLLPVFFGTLAIGESYLLARFFLPVDRSVYAALLVALAPSSVFLSQTAAPYAMVNAAMLLLVIVSAWGVSHRMGTNNERAETAAGGRKRRLARLALVAVFVLPVSMHPRTFFPVLMILFVLAGRPTFFGRPVARWWRVSGRFVWQGLAALILVALFYRVFRGTLRASPVWILALAPLIFVLWPILFFTTPAGLIDFTAPPASLVGLFVFVAAGWCLLVPGWRRLKAHPAFSLLAATSIVSATVDAPTFLLMAGEIKIAWVTTALAILLAAGLPGRAPTGHGWKEIVGKGLWVFVPLVAAVSLPLYYLERHFLHNHFSSLAGVLESVSRPGDSIVLVPSYPDYGTEIAYALYDRPEVRDAMRRQVGSPGRTPDRSRTWKEIFEAAKERAAKVDGRVICLFESPKPFPSPDAVAAAVREFAPDRRVRCTWTARYDFVAARSVTAVVYSRRVMPGSGGGASPG